MGSQLETERTEDSTGVYADWACPECGTLNEPDRAACTGCAFTTTPDDAERSRTRRWVTAGALGAVAIVGSLTVLIVGVQTVSTEMVPFPVLAGMCIAAVGMNLAVDSLDW